MEGQAVLCTMCEARAAAVTSAAGASLCVTCYEALCTMCGARESTCTALGGASVCVSCQAIGITMRKAIDGGVAPLDVMKVLMKACDDKLAANGKGGKL